MPLSSETVDLGNEPTSGDFTPDAPAPASAAGYDPAAGGLGNDPADIGNDPLSAPVAVSAQPVTGTLIEPFAVGYSPDANAAFTVTPGTLDSENNFTPGGPALGPFAAAVTLAAGVYSLAGTATPPLASGAISLQPGDYAGGVFSAIGPPITGTLLLADAPAPAAGVDFTVGEGVFSLAGQKKTAIAGSAGFLYFPVSAALEADGSAYDPTGAAVQVALTDGAGPLPADFLPASWVTRTAQPGTGLYVQLPLSGLGLPAGRYTGDIQTGGYLLPAPGFVTFQ